MNRFLSFCTAIFLWLGFTACSSEPALQFENPQPLNAPELQEFPAALQGEYQDPKDSTILLVTATAVIQKVRFEVPTSIQEMDKDSIPYQVKNDTFYSSDSPEGLPVLRSTPDSLFLLVTLTDTLFVQNAAHRLRKWKGAYFMNQQLAPNRWKVLCLKPVGRKKIQLLYLNDSVDLVKMQEILTLRKEEKIYLANPSQKELRKFLRQGGFRKRETFTRVPPSQVPKEKSGI
ncbi:class I SAM-dependent methyltransferase [Rufibacter radiotolerans]|nr:hypothetical protein [Rufibacter radiotolerans]